MNRPKKTTIVAQASSEMHTEAVLKFQPLTSSKPNAKDPMFGDGDGDDGEISPVRSYVIEVAMNGFFVTITREDYSEDRYIVNAMEEVLELIQGNI